MGLHIARLLLAFLVSVGAIAESRWLLLKSGPFEVYTDGGEEPGRTTLNQLEQLRYVLGGFLGKQEMQTPQPIRIAVRRGEKLSASLRAEVAKALLEANSKPMPREIEIGLITLFSTFEAEGTRLTLGTPPVRKDANWARMHLLTTDEQYSGKLRVFFSNLQKGVEEDVSYRNAFAQTPEQIEQAVKASLASNQFPAAHPSARALNAKRDFVPTRVDGPPTRAYLASVEFPKPVEPSPEREGARVPTFDLRKQRVERSNREREESRIKAERELQDLQNRALAEIRAAEARANEGKPPVDPNVKLDEYREDATEPRKITGSLDRVNCGSGATVLLVRTGAKATAKLLVVDPARVVIAGGGERAFACGVQRPIRKVAIEYNPRKDSTHATQGDVVSIEFRSN